MKLVQSLHDSGILQENDTFLYGGLACGFLLKMEGKWIYHAGDTGLFGDMALIGEQQPIEEAMLPIGDNYTMGPDDALFAARMLKAKTIIPMHFNTFELIKQDGKVFSDRMQGNEPAQQGILLKPGETLEI